MVLLCLVIALASCATALAAEARDVYYQGDMTPLNIVPTFDKGYLVVYDQNKVNIYAPDGSSLYSASAQVQSAHWAGIQNAAVDTDGTLGGAVRYCHRAKHTRGGGIVLFDRTGNQRRFVDTGPYLPTQVCFASDHSIWSIGWQGPEANAKNQDYFILRNYSQDGEQLGAFLPRSSFEAEPDPVGPMVGAWQLRTSNGRVGAAFYASSIVGMWQKPRSAEQWIETDLKGKEIGRWDFAGRSLLAFTQSGDIYGQDHDVAVFDRATNQWRPVAGTPDGHLLGADGDNLVFSLRGQNILRWVPLK
jgi:hypothetical protein